mmetsp:Transcript_16716/g.38152  ORF Transcript_16716/g.38152 Transcript_16716/m.38152 type:complete len:94 (-) Transcript_16716:494-775(-)
MKQTSVDILARRAEEAKLSNVAPVVKMIENFDATFDVALALHACGNATDLVRGDGSDCGGGVEEEGEVTQFRRWKRPSGGRRVSLSVLAVSAN